MDRVHPGRAGDSGRGVCARRRGAKLGMDASSNGANTGAARRGRGICSRRSRIRLGRMLNRSGRTRAGTKIGNQPRSGGDRPDLHTVGDGSFGGSNDAVEGSSGDTIRSRKRVGGERSRQRKKAIESGAVPSGRQAYG